AITGGCFLAQNYLIGNPSRNQDVFTNPNQIGYFIDPVTGLPAPPAGCTSSGTNLTLAADPFNTYGITDSNGNFVTNSAGNNAMCVANAFSYAAGPDTIVGTVDDVVTQLTATVGKDGLRDGFVDPVRIYKSMDFDVN